MDAVPLMCLALQVCMGWSDLLSRAVAAQDAGSMAANHERRFCYGAAACAGPQLPQLGPAGTVGHLSVEDVLSAASGYCRQVVASLRVCSALAR